jgi:uncharacterized BrkB/YihY/UPF0761 family membrane protein
MKSNNANLLNWAISLALIAIVAFVFAIAGTGSETASLLGSIVAICCLVLALVMFTVYIVHRHRHTSAG